MKNMLIGLLILASTSVFAVPTEFVIPESLKTEIEQSAKYSREDIQALLDRAGVLASMEDKSRNVTDLEKIENQLSSIINNELALRMNGTTNAIVSVDEIHTLQVANQKIQNKVLSAKFYQSK